MKRNTRIIIFFISILLFYGICHFVLQKNSYHVPVTYDTLGGVKVTKDNLLKLVASVPPLLKDRVIHWFVSHPGAYEILVRQREHITDIGQQILDGAAFLRQYKDVQILSSMSYIFMLPHENFLIKISGPANRFYNSIAELGIKNSIAYTRRMLNAGQEIYPYCSFEEDKERIGRCVGSCIPRAVRSDMVTKGQVDYLIDLIAGAMPHEMVGGIVYANINDMFSYDHNFQGKTVDRVISLLLDCACKVIKQCCCDVNEIRGKKLIDTYNIASRVFHRNRFSEAVKRFKLDALEEPPLSFIVNLCNTKSIEDKDVVLVQSMLNGYKPLEFYLRYPKLLDAVFTDNALYQLLVALEYAGVWDISGKNIFAHPVTKKITYVDFEHNRDITSQELFNASKERRHDNISSIILELLRRFAQSTQQKNTVQRFLADHKEIDIPSYLNKISSQVSKIKRGAPKHSILKDLLYICDKDNPRAIVLKEKIAQKIINC